MKKEYQKFIFTLASIFFSIVMIIGYFAWRTVKFDLNKSIQRDEKILLNIYYKNIDDNPEKAKKIMDLLKNYYPEKYKNFVINDVNKSKIKILKNSDNNEYKDKVENKQLDSINEKLKNNFPKIVVNYDHKESKKFRLNQSSNNIKKNVQDEGYFLKVKAYQYYSLKNYIEAEKYFVEAYRIHQEDSIAAQLGYLNDLIEKKHKAYQYFKIASHSKDNALALKSKIAMTNLAGWNTRLLPDPFFIDIYLSPVFLSRFNLAVLPIILRAGIYLDKLHHFELYSYLRNTQDNQSGGDQLSPQIFEDNVRITGVGIRYQIMKSFPLYYFAEAGLAYDLIFRNRNRYRGDFRSGFFLGKRWGAGTTYTDKLIFPWAYVNELYGEGAFYSRFDNNIIATFRDRPGLRVFEWGPSYLDIYMKEQFGVDTRHEFFNNYLEYGPGIVLVPNNRFNFAIRYERVWGIYIPVDSPSINPYGPRYQNQIVQCEFYVRF